MGSDADKPSFNGGTFCLTACRFQYPAGRLSLRLSFCCLPFPQGQISSPVASTIRITSFLKMRPSQLKLGSKKLSSRRIRMEFSVYFDPGTYTAVFPFRASANRLKAQFGQISSAVSLVRSSRTQPSSKIRVLGKGKIRDPNDC